MKKLDKFRARLLNLKDQEMKVKKELLSNAGWVLSRICELRLLKPIYEDKVVFCAKVLINSTD